MDYIRCSSSEEEFQVLEILGEQGFRWRAGEYPTEYMPSEQENIDFRNDHVYICVYDLERVLSYVLNYHENFIDAQDFIAPPEIPAITNIEELWK